MVDGLGNEEVKEAATPEPPAADIQQRKDSVTADQIMSRGGSAGGPEVISLKPTKTYDDLVPLERLKKRLVRDGLVGKPILVGLMVIDRVGHYGTFEGKNVIIVPQYFIRRYGVRRDDGTYSVYHMRSDGRAQRVGFRALTEKDFIDPKPVETSTNL